VGPRVCDPFTRRVRTTVHPPVELPVNFSLPPLHPGGEGGVFGHVGVASAYPVSGGNSKASSVLIRGNRTVLIFQGCRFLPRLARGPAVGPSAEGFDTGRVAVRSTIEPKREVQERGPRMARPGVGSRRTKTQRVPVCRIIPLQPPSGPPRGWNKRSRAPGDLHAHATRLCGAKQHRARRRGPQDGRTWEIPLGRAEAAI
jgi:hypothetical protein